MPRQYGKYSKSSRNGRSGRRPSRYTGRVSTTAYPSRTTGRTTRGIPSSQKILKCPTIFPDRYRCTLRFSEMGTKLSSQTTLVWAVQTQSNPLGSSIQMQGWDQMQALYLAWRPLAMRVRITAGIGQDHNRNILMLRGYWSQYATPLGSDLAVIQNRFTKTMNLTKMDGFKTMSSASNLRNVWGMSEEEWMTNNTTRAAIDTHPLRRTTYYIHVRYPPHIDNFYWDYEITGEMDIEFSDPRILMDDTFTPGPPSSQ